jgi:hypothetical protein
LATLSVQMAWLRLLASFRKVALVLLCSTAGAGFVCLFGL